MWAGGEKEVRVNYSKRRRLWRGKKNSLCFVFIFLASLQTSTASLHFPTGSINITKTEQFSKADREVVACFLFAFIVNFLQHFNREFYLLDRKPNRNSPVFRVQKKPNIASSRETFHCWIFRLLRNLINFDFSCYAKSCQTWMRKQRNLGNSTALKPFKSQFYIALRPSHHYHCRF